MQKHCDRCDRPMQRWGRTAKGTARFYCPACKKTSVWKRKDVAASHIRHEFDGWLGGKDSMKEVAEKYHKTRQAMWKEFHPLFEFAQEPRVPRDLRNDILIVDATYIHGHILCALVAIDEHDRIFWRFAPYESFASWHRFLTLLPQPKVVVMDGQKGLFAVVRMIWPSTKVQRCQFHVIAFAIQYLGRHPKDEAGQAILKLLYELKEAKTPEGRDQWVLLYKIWEKQYEKDFNARSESGRFQNPRLRSVRYIMRRALPYLFTFLDYPGTPNTTNLVEGWVNGAVAEALRRHRGLRAREKKTLVSIILSHLSRAGHAKERVVDPAAILPSSLASVLAEEDKASEVPF
jgi:hypothetical protein